MQDAIGVFDSGMGGLTVLRALRAEMPDADFVYLGDTARLPYGTKSPETVRRYSEQAAQILVDRGVGSLVIACNTASGLALDHLTKTFDPLSVFGVVKPGAIAAANVVDESGVLVLATESTVASGAYQSALTEVNPEMRVEARACPLWVTLAEQGITAGSLTKAIIDHDLQMIVDNGPNTVLLGCTHFPVFKSFLQENYPTSQFVDSAETTAKAVVQTLGTVKGEARMSFLATDGIERFQRIGGFFLGEPVADVELVDL